MSADKIRLHIESISAKSPHMQITDAVYAAAAERHPELASRIAVTIGFDCSEFDNLARDAEIVLGQGFPTQDLAERAPVTQWVNAVSAGVENLMPLTWLPAGAVMTNNSGTHVPRVREYALMMLLGLHQRLPEMVTQQRECKWRQIFASTIAGQRAVIVGMGNLGGAVADAARQLGVSVIGVNRSGRPHPSAERTVAIDQLDAVLDRADFLVIAAPLTAATRGLIGAEELALLPEGAGLLNIGRGPIVDTVALQRALDSGRLSGAVLDVFDPEPLSADSPLWSQPNLLITPHNSSDDPKTYIPRSLDMFFENLGRYISGEPLLNVIDPDLGY
jgi:phosphoglycerate dehydrogenase-like enzyme